MNTERYFAFIPNAGKYRPEKTPYLDTFHPVNYVCRTFAILDFLSEYVLKLVFDSCAGITVPGKYLQIAQLQTFNNKRRNID